MLVEFAEGDVRALLDSLRYSMQRIRDAQGTPFEAKTERLARPDEHVEKLRTVRVRLLAHVTQ